MSDRRVNYKNVGKHGGGVEASRRRQRDATASLRKQNRHAQMARKRLRDVCGESSVVTSIDSIPQLVQKMAVVKSPAECFPALQQLRRMLANDENSIESFLRCADAVDILKELLCRTSDTNIQLEAIWCHVNISASKSEHTRAVLKNSPCLIAFLENASPRHQDLSAWALGNMAGDSPDARDTIIAQGAHYPLVRIVTNQSIAMPSAPPTDTSVAESAYFALSNLCRGKGARPELFGDDNVLKATLRLLEIHVTNALKCTPPIPALAISTATEGSGTDNTPQTRASAGVATEMLWFLTYMTANNEPLCGRLVKDGLLALLVSAMQAETELGMTMVSPSLRTLGNVLAGDDSFTAKALLQPNLLSAIGRCVTSPQRPLQLESLWVLSNIVAGDASFVSAVMEEGLLPYVVSILDYSMQNDPEMAVQAMYVINNAVHHGQAVCEYLFNQTDVLRHVLRALRGGNVDICHLVLQFFEMTLRAQPEISSLVEEEGGVEALEMFEYHENEALQIMASDMLDRFFYTEDEQHDDV